MKVARPAPGTCRSHVEAPGQDKNGIENDVQNTAAHGADAGVNRRAFASDHLALDHVQNGRQCAEVHRPQQVPGGGLPGGSIGAQQIHQRGTEHHRQQGEQQAAEHRTIKSKRRAGAHHFIVASAQTPAHHAGCTHAKQVVHRVERQHHRVNQRNRRILYRVIEHSHEERIRQVVNDHHQGGHNHGNCQRCHRPGNGHLLKHIHFSVILRHIIHTFPANPPKKSNIISIPQKSRGVKAYFLSPFGSFLTFPQGHGRVNTDNG